MRRMTKRDLEFELNGEMSEEEIDKFINDMEKYAVKLPSSEEINLTIENLHAFVPVRQKRSLARPKLFGILERAFNEISFMSNNYWVASSGLFLAGFLVILLNGGYILKDNNPYILAILLSPIPFVLGIMEVFKGREEGVIELELSCKISITEIIISRLVIICIYNVLLNTIMSGILVYFGTGIVFWKITLFWLTPFTIVASLSLPIASKMRGSYVVTMFTATWMILIISVLSQEKIMSRIMGIDLMVYMLLSMVGIVLLSIQIVGFSHRHGSFFEGSVLNEVKN
jgi:hypothetical protein